MRAGQSQRKVVQAWVVADHHQAAHGFGHAADDAEQFGGARMIEPIHDLDDRSFVPWSERFQRLDGPPGGGHEDHVGYQAKIAYDLPDRERGGAAAQVQRARVVGLGLIVPGRFRVAEEEELSHRVCLHP